MATQMALDLKAERRRLSHQCSMILGMLQQGTLTNRELAAVSLKYTSRISDLRKRGHDVRCTMRDRATGLSQYTLFVDGQPA